MKKAKSPNVSMIAAHTNGSRVIAKDGKIPWSIKEDLQYFKKTTMGKVIIVGRKTFMGDFRGKPLPGRTHVIMTKDKSFEAPEGHFVAHSKEEALEIAIMESKKNNQPEIMIVGGREIYEMFMENANKLYITIVHTKINSDVCFPAYSHLFMFRRIVGSGYNGFYNYDYTIIER